MILRGKRNGAKHTAEAMGSIRKVLIGRGAFHQRRRDTGRSSGADGSENAGMSSEKHVRTMFIEISKESRLIFRHRRVERSGDTTRESSLLVDSGGRTSADEDGDK